MLNLRWFRQRYHTLRHLKPRQIGYQIKYRLIKPRKLRVSQVPDSLRMQKLRFGLAPPAIEVYREPCTFVFLNKQKSFEGGINWNFQGYGKLWNYHLQYGTFLAQSGLQNDKKRELISSLYAWLRDGRLPLEPYPVSLRVMHMMQWLSSIPETHQNLLECLHAELYFLSRCPEYHLMANHLLENGFALYMGGYFFSNNVWIHQGKKILEGQMQEQVLADGAHFELSSSYHNLMLWRMLQLIDFAELIPQEQAFVAQVRQKAALMLGWISQMKFRSGEMPHFSDSAPGMAPAAAWLLETAGALKLTPVVVPLGPSGYRAINTGNYECRVDVGNSGPDYQPGHAHADALSFVLHYNGQPVFTEQGTSTYEVSPQRSAERSTAAHNTVTVEGKSQSEMWGAFRVARRARTTLIDEKPGLLVARHDGYRTMRCVHQRSFVFNKSAITITDLLEGTVEREGVFHLHFHPGIIPSLQNNEIRLSRGIRIVFADALDINLSDYRMANGFNQYQPARKAEARFKQKLVTRILFPA